MSSIRFGRGREYQFFRREDVRLRWDLQSAVQFLNGFRSDKAAMAGFRWQVLASGTGGPQANLADEQVIQSLGQMLASGALVVVPPDRKRHIDLLGTGTPVSAPAEKKKATKEQAEVFEDAPTFEPDNDGAAQAKVLVAAAAGAYPFCEECARYAAQQAAHQ